MKIDLMNSGLNAGALGAAGFGGAGVAKANFGAEHDVFVLEHGGVNLDVQQMAAAGSDFADFKNGLFKRFCLLGAGDLRDLARWACGALFCKGERLILITVNMTDDFARFDPVLAARALQKSGVIPVVAVSPVIDLGRSNSRGGGATLPFGSAAARKAERTRQWQRLNRVLQEFLKELPCSALLWGCGPALIEAPLFACATACVTDLELDFNYELNTTLAEWKKAEQKSGEKKPADEYPDKFIECLRMQQAAARVSSQTAPEFLKESYEKSSFLCRQSYYDMERPDTELALMSLERPVLSYVQRLDRLASELGSGEKYPRWGGKSDLFQKRIIPVFTCKGDKSYVLFALRPLAMFAHYDAFDFYGFGYGDESVIRVQAARRGIFLIKADSLVREMLAGKIGKSSKTVIKLNRKWPEAIFFAECTDLTESEKKAVRRRFPEPICQTLLDCNDLEKFFRKNAAAEKYQSYEYEPAPPYKHRAFFAPVKFIDVLHDFSVSFNFSGDFYRAIKNVRVSVGDLMSALKTLSQLQEAGGRRPSSKNFWQNKEEEFSELLLKLSAGHKEAA